MFVREFKNLNSNSFKEFVPSMKMPLDIEIGCGVGWHAIDYSAKNPDRYLVAIERTKTRFTKFSTRLKHNPRPNLLAMNTDAMDWISSRIAPVSVDRYFLLYPNPYPKSRQKNKRWVNMPFFRYLLSTLKNNGEIHLATNESFYFDEFCHQLKKVWEIDKIACVELNNAAKARTHFEKKYLLRGETCFSLRARV